ncbi:MAG: tRNA (adenosine(37)-N6)-threonylcarbamoyltransferase complex dimerization subunit type 1 TsaB [Bacteroidetes bacterium]|nr:MAG: tRNA (adenosine(37)-N6)-threonylcarbamoyltransferase complex dimerization subunit type 1 TsaB [Bacteroidota bacterium]MBL1143548.1 tRNA (adenosine(37)-N6)-threonylcarbamoyltransferase complex dimerization subunit type 1 TsaB [Bacteroidota bacterium]NOG56350.1 tRNA (adenosine(37)-N6)-threonylcarbamoyltransferase complex dimerization subunit type 1 TsaB [Bacteroidota bacterium]
MALILAIETATKICSVALFKNNELIDCEELGGQYSHAELLAPFADTLLKRNGCKIADLNAIAVSKGPGSYTGLRIGVAFAKGICYGNSIPLIAINTLEAMAYGAIEKLKDNNALYCPMIDARRMEVYVSLFHANGEELEAVTAKIIDETSFEEKLKSQKVYFFGDGAAKCQSILNATNADFSYSGETSARHMGNLAFQKYELQQFEDLAYFEPYYLKEFLAIKSKKLV